NALHYSYSNGPLECLNNHIKVLKRNAYGFRNFYNFKLRIMIRKRPIEQYLTNKCTSRYT
ncbi:transposase, partial [Enterococcus faecium]|uniref:transposase n=1 Tax=Enterococcus faecium TaxID=1352 RepID=UPI00292E2C49